MCWQIRRLRPQNAAFAATRENKIKFGEMEESVAAFEQNAMTCSSRLLSVLHGLVELETAMVDAGLPEADLTSDGAVKERVSRNADVSVEVLEEGFLRVSRLDNIAAALVVELEGLGGRLSQFNDRYAMMDAAALNRMNRVMAENIALPENVASFRHRHDADDTLDLNDAYQHLTTRLDTLRKQIVAVQTSLVPISIDHLNALDEKMETENQDLVKLANSFIGVIVCAGLTAFTTPDRSFYQAFGLNPTLGYVRFRFERALMLVAGPLATYFLYLIAQSLQMPAQTF